MSNGLTSTILIETVSVDTTWMENSVCKITFKLVENCLRIPRNVFILVYEFNVNLTINVLVSSFRFIWIPLLWVHNHYKYFTVSVWRSTLDFRSTSESDVYDVRFWRLKTVPALKGLKPGPRCSGQHYRLSRQSGRPGVVVSTTACPLFRYPSFKGTSCFFSGHL